MKAGHDIEVDRKRRKLPKGGALESLDPVSQGRVQVLLCSPDPVEQAMVAVEELVRLSRLDPDWNWARTAVISRDWERLNSVRSYAESLGIPVELANEKLPSIWRLREMQWIVNKLREDPACLCDIRQLVSLLNQCERNRWTELIAEGIAALARELGERQMPSPDLIEWLAEWSRDVRGEQRGLLLLTAHRAKGLEFDDVVILGGNWQALSKGEDSDSPRRLFYVAMTRARRSLSVISHGKHPFIEPTSSVLTRQASHSGAKFSQSSIYHIPDMKAVDLSWAGRLSKKNSSISAISEAKVGDPISLREVGNKWIIFNSEQVAIGRMSAKWQPPKGLTLKRGEVGAIIQWKRTDNSQEFHPTLQRDQWETVLPDLEFA